MNHARDYTLTVGGINTDNIAVCIYDKFGNEMPRPKKNTKDMENLLKHYIEETTTYVLQIGEKTFNATVFDAQFRAKGRFYSNVLLSLLEDIRRIPEDHSILEQKKYTNFSGIVPADVEQLASLSHIIFYYYIDQSDKAHDPELDMQKNAGLLRGLEHHFQTYRDDRYTPPTEGSGDAPFIRMCRMDNLLARLDALC